MGEVAGFKYCCVKWKFCQKSGRCTILLAIIFNQINIHKLDALFKLFIHPWALLISDKKEHMRITLHRLHSNAIFLRFCTCYFFPSLSLNGAASPLALFAVSPSPSDKWQEKLCRVVNVSLGIFSSEIWRGEFVRSKRDLYSVLLLLCCACVDRSV